MKKLTRTQKVLLLILFIGLFLRAYKPLALFEYSHDQDLLGWMVKDVLVNKHLRLIGQETSSQGVFIGSLYYYFQIPFYLIFGLDPAGGLVLPIILGGLTIFSFYFVLKTIFDERVGLLAALIYALSYSSVFTDREVVPTVPVLLWTIWFLFALEKILKGNRIGYLLAGCLLGLVWNVNLALFILSPLILLAAYLAKKFDPKGIFFLVVSFLVFMAPFFLFETRHDFLQTKAIFSSLTSAKDFTEGTSTGLAKFDRVMQLIKVNSARLFWGKEIPIPVDWTIGAILLCLGILHWKKKLVGSYSAIFLSWFLLFVIFFSVNTINVSEYYLNGINVVFVALLAIGLNELLKAELVLKRVGKLFILLFVSFNLYSFFTRRVSGTGYLEKKALVNFILKDLKARGYPCVSISYITAPGYNLGYRYLFWINKMHVNNPISGSPVYTIVFPHKLVERVDYGFGSLGLVLPDYERYEEDLVTASCQGENSNLTDPMFGYVE